MAASSVLSRRVMVNRPHISSALCEDLAQPIFKKHLGRRSRGGFQPRLEVLYPNRVLNLGMLYFNRDPRLAAPDVLDPFIVAENPERLSDRLVDAAGAHLRRAFHS